eukprot:6760489-Pyramimonas_sp.AAC.1
MGENESMPISVASCPLRAPATRGLSVRVHEGSRPHPCSLSLASGGSLVRTRAGPEQDPRQ